ncbi:hypothetical protein PMKS-000475 [Pichia membranifaciens]|uniref:Uncharacterized protein n=1 Tax=Pichia membranifaciens TaxID=4926 RepID=A0A1Q2YBU9_9ASCO|nr:hypothetical protein PMKS-000475 [Pichia membranifaciens]
MQQLRRDLNSLRSSVTSDKENEIGSSLSLIGAISTTITSVGRLLGDFEAYVANQTDKEAQAKNQTRLDKLRSEYEDSRVEFGDLRIRREEKVRESERIKCENERNTLFTPNIEDRAGIASGISDNPYSIEFRSNRKHGALNEEGSNDANGMMMDQHMKLDRSNAKLDEILELGRHAFEDIVEQNETILRVKDKMSQGLTTLGVSPGTGQHAHVGGTISVKSPGDGGAGRLDTFIEAGVVSSFFTVVGKCTHEPQAVTLVHGVEDPVEDVEEHWADICAVLKVHCCDLDGAVCVRGDVGSCKTFLELVTSTPDGHGDAEEEPPTDSGTDASSEPLEVQDGTHDDSTEHLEKPVEQGVQRSSSDVETAGVELVELVGVEPVGGKEHREHDQDLWFFDKQLEGAQDLCFPVRKGLIDDSGAVVSPDFFLWQHEEGDNTTAAHEDHESNVGAVLDGGGVGVHVVG